ncbi:hypothetical protein ANO11243_076310 [Dothideomycetidae sp. 11243]|nr:hypothetical protein ANO11243_076310 [fungal sp. No.11243]
MAPRAARRMLVLALLTLLCTAGVLLTISRARSRDRNSGTWHIQPDLVDHQHVAAPPHLLHNDREYDQQIQDLSAGNATLGFNAVLALSRGTKWRVNGLNAAANASGISLLIPAQPVWSKEFVHSFEAFGPVDAHGAAMAWLGHIDLLKFVIQNKWGSALIMEDDMDWDVRIRQQTAMIAQGTRELARKRDDWESRPHNRTDDNPHSPYGDTWDVLWMGHCSDPPRAKPLVVWPDATVIARQRYAGIDRLVTTVLEEGERSVHRSVNPVCTFAYAISAAGARKVLAIASTGKGGAFDLMLNHNCKQGTLDCVSVNPEVFDPYHPADGDKSEVRAGDTTPGTEASFEDAVSQVMGHTDNILRSARCQGLWATTCLTS